MYYFGNKKMPERLSFENHENKQSSNRCKQRSSQGNYNNSNSNSNKPPLKQFNNNSSSSYLKNFKKGSNQPHQNHHHHHKQPQQNYNSKYNNLYQQEQQANNFAELMNETDNSMQQMLNSSINQFERFLFQGPRQMSLQEQNHHLRNALNKLKIILKEKLETALKKQKSELSKMLQDYITLINKLLQDKQQLTITLHDLQKQLVNGASIKQLEEKIKQEYEEKLAIALAERDEQISITKKQIDQFLDIITQYEQQAKNQNQKFEQMQNRIDDLERGKNKQHQLQTNVKIQAQSTKIQTLLQLLQKSQQENYQLRQQLKSRQLKGPKDLKQHYQSRFRQLEAQHEQQFIQYQKAIKQTISKKDQCIERLNLIIQQLRIRDPLNSDLQFQFYCNINCFYDSKFKLVLRSYSFIVLVISAKII